MTEEIDLSRLEISSKKSEVQSFRFTDLDLVSEARTPILKKLKTHNDARDVNALQWCSPRMQDSKVSSKGNQLRYEPLLHPSGQID